jgi:hypothetical protein
VLEDVVVESAESKAGMPRTCETAFRRSARVLVSSKALRQSTYSFGGELLAIQSERPSATCDVASPSPSKRANSLVPGSIV